MATRRALLLIADIGGYTEYMQSHRSILGHAEAATTRMLEKVVDAARDFDLIEIEGDAAFLSREADGLDGAATLAAITEAAVAMHRAFHAQRRLVELNMCPCGSCTQTSDLKLKFVAHVGEVATQTIKRRRKLVGMDVIFVHRLLKNPVQVPEYVLVSEDLYRSGGTSSPEHADARDLAGPRGHRARAHLLRGRRRHRRAARLRCRIPPGSRRIGGTVGMVGRGLPYILRRRRPRDTASRLIAAAPASGSSAPPHRPERSASRAVSRATTSWPAVALTGYPVTAVRNARRCRTLTRRCASADARMVAVRGRSLRRAISPKPSPGPSVLTTRPSRTTSARPDSTT